MIPELEYIRMAAFVDGEGCIRINKTNTRTRYRHDLRVILVNTDPRLVLWAKACFGGSITRMYISPNTPNSYPRFSWELSGTSAASLLDKIYPYLLLKKEEAAIGMAFQATKTSTWGGRNKRTPPSVMTHRDELYNKMRLVKSKRLTLEDAQGAA